MTARELSGGHLRSPSAPDPLGGADVVTELVRSGVGAGVSRTRFPSIVYSSSVISPRALRLESRLSWASRPLVPSTGALGLTVGSAAGDTTGFGAGLVAVSLDGSGGGSVTRP